MKKFFATVTAVALTCGVAGLARADVKIGDKIPKIDVTQLYNNEYNVDVSDLNGYVVVLEFWATWCGPCKMNIPHMDEMYTKFQDKGVLFLGLSDEPDATVKGFLPTSNIKYLVASGSKVGRSLGINGIPYAVIYDPSGVAKWTHVGYPMDDMEAAIKSVLAATPPTRMIGGGPEFNEKELSSIEDMLSKGDTTDAVKELRRVDRKSLHLKPEHQTRYDAIVGRLTPLAQSEYDSAEGMIKAKNYTDGIAALKRVADKYAGLPIADRAANEARTLANSDAVIQAARNTALDRVADNMLARAKDQASGGDKVMAYKKLKALVAKYPHTPAAAEANKMIKSFEADADFMKQVNGG